MIKTCRSKECELYEDYKYWNEHQNYSMPDNCSRCKRAYPDMFSLKSGDA